MPVLKNARHEKFAQSLAKGKSATDAYQDAGYKPDRKNAARLTTKDDISRRVDEIKSRVAEKAEWTSAQRLLDLKAIFDRVAENDARVAISAISEANKMQGSYAPSKHEHKGQFTFVSITQETIAGLTPDERVALAAALPVLGKLGFFAEDVDDG